MLALAALSQQIENVSKQLENARRQIMASLAELETELVAANEATNEIAADLQDLINKLAAGGMTPAEEQSVLEQLAALRTKLQGVAATHTA